MTNTDTTTDTTSEVTAVVDAYLASLDEADDAVRAHLVAKAWAPDGRFVDPLQEYNGHAELRTINPVIQQHYPGARFRRVSGIDVHHDVVRFAWDMTAPDGSQIVAGIDIGQLGPDGRLLSITGFFGDLPDA
jgi:hypothetical protein